MLPLLLRNLSSSPTRLRSTLSNDPKYNANTVHVIVITLYGMLKSGVVKGTSNTSVYNITGLFAWIKRPESIKLGKSKMKHIENQQDTGNYTT